MLKLEVGTQALVGGDEIPVRLPSLYNPCIGHSYMYVHVVYSCS